MKQAIQIHPLEYVLFYSGLVPFEAVTMIGERCFCENWSLPVLAGQLQADHDSDRYDEEEPYKNKKVSAPMHPFVNKQAVPRNHSGECDFY